MNGLLKKLLKPFVSFNTKTNANGSKTKSWNIKNYSINYLLAPLYFIFTFIILKKLYHYQSWTGLNLNSAGSLALVSTFFYCYVSTFFQPDLDQEIHRPGKHAFPFGDKIGKVKLGSILRDLVKPITFVWYWAWHPYGKLVTHRGASHWPVWGVWMRVAWVFVIYLFVEGVYFALELPMPKYLYYWKYWMKAFFPWNPEFNTIVFWLLCFPVYIGDIFHSAVDLGESLSKGVPFCSHLHKRGLIIRLTKWAFAWPKFFVDQAKHLRGD